MPKNKSLRKTEWPLHRPVNMKMHETMTSNCGMYSILRVPNGWVYSTWHFDVDTDDWYVTSSVFVPIYKELKDETK